MKNLRIITFVLHGEYFIAPITSQQKSSASRLQRLQGEKIPGLLCSSSFALRGEINSRALVRLFLPFWTL